MAACLPVPLPSALLFGALMSATDPVAVVALFRKLRVPRRLAVIVEGESLLNDGTSIVLFNLILASALAPSVRTGAAPDLLSAAVDFLRHVANVLEVLQLGKGCVDMTDRDHAGDAGDHDHRQQQRKTGKGELPDRQRERPDTSGKYGKGHGVLEPARENALL